MVLSNVLDAKQFCGGSPKPVWEPACALQVNPESADEVEMDSMWTRHGVHQGDSLLNDKSVRLSCLI